MASGDRYVIYLRKSRADAEAEAHGEGETLARHERALLDLSRRLHLPVGAIYREVVSGETIAARPVMQQLLTEVEDGQWDGVLVMEVERLARGDTIDQGIVAQTFQFSDTKIITPSKIYDPNNEFDEEYFEFGLFMSRREYKTINRRLQRGRLASVKEGKYVCSAPPYGYQRQKLEKEKGFTLVPDPVQAPVVKLIFDLYTTGEKQSDGTFRRLGVSLIVRRLEAMKVKPQRGGHWSPASLRDMLINPVYVGKVRWNCRPNSKRRVNGVVEITRPRAPEDTQVLVEGRHEPLVTEEVFEKAQRIMAQNRAPAIREKGVVQNPLAGLMVCGKCGHKMQRRPYLAQGRKDTLICPYTFCDNVGSDLDRVEAHVLDALALWLRDYQLEVATGVHTPDSKVDVQRKTIQQLDAELEKLRKQRDNLHDLLEQGVYDTDTFLERSRSVAGRITAAERDKAALETDLSMEAQRAAAREQIIPKVQHLLEAYGTLTTPAARNILLREVLEKVVYTKEKSGRWGNPDDFIVKIYPRLPVST